ncbi:sphingosine kinase a b, partial [Danaus plexippus plexippus]
EPYITHNLTGLSMALVRGKTANMDVVRVETKTKIMYSFLSVGWGLLADIDIESEKLRVIGGQRFTLWALARLIGLRKYKGVIHYARIKDVSNLPKPKLPLTISHSVSHDGELDSPDTEDFVDCYENSETLTNVVNGKRHKRVDSWHSTNSRRSTFYSTRGSEYHSVTSSGSEMRSPVHACMHGPASHLPSLMSQLPSHWEREEGEFVMAYVSYQAYIGEDLLFAPRSQLSDGVMWLLIIKAGITRSQIFSFLMGMSHGSHSEINGEYIKMIPVSAFRLVPEGPNGYITVDGELVEYGPIQAEIFPNIVNLLVPTNNL